MVGKGASGPGWETSIGAVIDKLVKVIMAARECTDAEVVLIGLSGRWTSGATEGRDIFSGQRRLARIVLRCLFSSVLPFFRVASVCKFGAC